MTKRDLHPSISRMRRRLRSIGMLALGAVTAFVAIGCQSRDGVETEYGRRRGASADQSVAGVSVLSEMFEEAGHSVRTQKKINPHLEREDVIVWAPDNFDPPSEEAQEFLEKWLARGTDRTLIYIGRDYDAVSEYWRYAAQTAPAEYKAEAERRAGLTRAEYHDARANISTGQECRWYVVEDTPQTTITTLSGPWAKDINPARADIPVWSRLVPRGLESDELRAEMVEVEPDDEFEYIFEDEYGEYDSDPYDDYYSEYWVDYSYGAQDPFDEVNPWLKSGDVNLVTELRDYRWNEGRIILVQNGSFTLNLPLGNAQNRLLAARLVDEVGDDRNVVFLESGPNGIGVSNVEPEDEFPSPTNWADKKPWPTILPHFGLLAVVLLMSLAPIFGRARSIGREAISDFSKHVRALGSLLRVSGERTLMDTRLRDYHVRVRGDTEFPKSRPEPNANRSE
jgi:hypothetical protein